VSIKRYAGEIEIDLDRNVIYFHTSAGYTMLRIGGLNLPEDNSGRILQIDMFEPRFITYSTTEDF